MKKKGRLIAFATVFAVAALWLGGIIPKQIAKICGEAYGKDRFPEMGLACTEVEWSDAHGDYLVTLQAENGTVYRCVIGPRYLPVSIGQGLFALESDYAK